MKNIALKLNENLLNEADSIISSLQISRNNYINQAVSYFNQLHKKQLLAAQLKKESTIVSADSLEVLHEFEQLNDEY